MKAEQSMRRALSELSDAEFEIYTSPADEIYDSEDGEFDDFESNVDTI